MAEASPESMLAILRRLIELSTLPPEYVPPPQKVPDLSVPYSGYTVHNFWNLKQRPSVERRVRREHPGYPWMMEFERDLLGREVACYVDALPSREAMILRKRFGLDGRTWTLREVGTLMSLSGGRIRQIESNALHRLRRTLRKPASDD